MSDSSVKQLESFEDYNSPWARFYARSIDYAIIGNILSIFTVYLIPSYRYETSPEQSGTILAAVVSSVLSTFIWVFIESLLLAYVGTTPGKFILNIKLITEDNKKLSLKKAFNRSLLVWIKGVALGIPMIQLFTMYAQYRLVNAENTTSWDNTLSITCVCDQKRFIKVFMLFIIFIIGYISYTVLYKQADLLQMDTTNRQLNA